MISADAFRVGFERGLHKAAAEKKSRPFARDYLRHSALNAGQAVRDVRFLLDHPRAEGALDSLKLRVPSLGNNLLFTALPPQMHHTPEELADMDKATAAEWFLSGYAPWKNKIKGDSYNGKGDKPRAMKLAISRQLVDRAHGKIINTSRETEARLNKLVLDNPHRLIPDGYEELHHKNQDLWARRIRFHKRQKSWSAGHEAREEAFRARQTAEAIAKQLRKKRTVRGAIAGLGALAATGAAAAAVKHHRDQKKTASFGQRGKEFDDKLVAKVREFQARLRPGDIINTSPRKLTDFISKIYKPISTAVQGTPFGHSAIYVGNGKIIEARMGEGVTEKPLVEAAAENKMIAVRVREADTKTRRAAVEYAKKMVGKDFSLKHLAVGGLTPNAVTSVLGGPSKRVREKLDAAFCSQLVANAWHKIPFHKDRSISFTRPVDIIKSEHVEHVAKLAEKKKRRQFVYLQSGLFPFGRLQGSVAAPEGPVPTVVPPAPGPTAPPTS